MLFTISLTQNKDFLRLYKKGNSTASRSCVFYFSQNKLPFNRLGITTSKKIGNAVARNRARRIIRAAYSQNELEFPVGYDIVVVARNAATEVKSDEVAAFFRKRAIPEMTRQKPKADSGRQKKG